MREYKLIEMPTFPIGTIQYVVSVKTCSAVFTWCNLRSFSTKKEAEDFVKTNPTSADR